MPHVVKIRAARVVDAACPGVLDRCVSKSVAPELGIGISEAVKPKRSEYDLRYERVVQIGDREPLEGRLVNPTLRDRPDQEVADKTPGEGLNDCQIAGSGIS